MNQEILITNCRLYTDLTIDDISILIKNGTIERVQREYYNADCTHIDAGGCIAIPGLIDVHLQGAGGADVLDGTTEAVETISRTLARLGTTGFLATTVVKPDKENAHLRLLGTLCGTLKNGARMLGIHIEGPFINPMKKGGIAPASIYESSTEALEEILSVCGGNLSMMTIAPELPDNLAVIAALKQHGVIASFAHSDATYEETREGIEAGISHVTHICNAMRSIHHREPGPLPAIFEHPEITAQIISDGHHLHGGMVVFLYRNLGAERCVLITDGVQAMGLEEGNYFYNGKEYISKNGAAKYLDGTLIGSTMPLLQIAQKFMRFTGCPMHEAIDAASLNPARLLGIAHKKGGIEVGKDADIVLIDDDWNVKRVFIGNDFELTL
jgi:N-acetylglucosamine-6-phosphate deacetylase